MQVTAGRYGAHNNSIASQHGAARVSFDVFISNSLHSSGSIDGTFTYNVDRRAN